MPATETLFFALVTFALGLISAAYGAQTSKSFDSRKELLEKMRLWINESVLDVKKSYIEAQIVYLRILQTKDRNKILEMDNELKLNNDGLSFFIQKLMWEGIVAGLHNTRILQSLNRFNQSITEFNRIYLQHGNASTESIENNLRQMLAQVQNIENSAVELHKVITQELVTIPFWSIQPRARLNKWRIFFVILAIVISIVGIWLFYLA